MSLGLDMRARRACAGSLSGIWRGSKENIRARKGHFWRYAQAYMYVAKIAVYVERSQHTCNGSRVMYHKSWGRRHQIEVSKAQLTRSLLTFVSQDMLLVVRPPRLTCNGACAYTTRCVYPPPPSLRRRTAAPDTVALCEMCPLCNSRRCVKGRRRRMRRQPWFLVQHACLELRRLMPAGWPCQVGAGLLSLFASTFF